MSIDPNTPVLLGAGQFTERLDDQFEGLMPEDLAARACEAALTDTGAAEAVSSADRSSRLREIVCSLCAGFYRARYRPLRAKQQSAIIDSTAARTPKCLSNLFAGLW